MAEGNKALKWIGIGCGLFLLLGLCAGGGVALMCQSQLGPPVDASASFFADVRRGNYQQALSRMNGNYQTTHPLPTFQQNVQQIPALTQQTGASFNSTSVNNDVATVSGNLTTPTGDVPVTVTLSQVGGAWYIDSVMVQGQTLM
jgi:hypothetical protein